MPEVSPARAAAFDALTTWRMGRGGRAEDVLAGEAARHGLDRRDRALAYELFYGVIRNLIRLDHELKNFIKRKTSKVDPDVMDALRLAAYQVIFLDRVPAHAAVNDAVEQVKQARGRGAASFTNGVLRAMLRHGTGSGYPDKDSDPAGFLSVKHSFPPWLCRRWLDRFGQEGAGMLMTASNAVPPLTIRANTLRTDTDELASMMAGSGVKAEKARYAPDGLVLSPGTAVHELPGYTDGLFAVQDEAAQLVSLLLGAGHEETVFDACAAPGGKAAHIHALSGGSSLVLAADIGLDKSMLMKENITRLGATGVRPVVMDSSGALPVRGTFDRVLVDAPCSALGIIRRRPEVKYARREADIARLSLIQSGIIENVAQILKPGGVLVYSTCTTEPEEGEDVVERLISKGGFEADDASRLLPPDAASMVTEKGYLRSYPHVHGTDGFFAARLVRKR